MPPCPANSPAVDANERQQTPLLLLADTSSSGRAAWTEETGRCNVTFNGTFESYGVVVVSRLIVRLRAMGSGGVTLKY